MTNTQFSQIQDKYREIFSSLPVLTRPCNEIVGRGSWLRLRRIIETHEDTSQSILDKIVDIVSAVSNSQILTVEQVRMGYEVAIILFSDNIAHPSIPVTLDPHPSRETIRTNVMNWIDA